MVKIEFFRKGKSLGSYPLKERSNHEDRDEVAKVNQIGDYDRFILDDGRAVGARLSRAVNQYTDDNGNTWISWDSKSDELRDAIDLGKVARVYPMTKEEAYEKEGKG